MTSITEGNFPTPKHASISTMSTIKTTYSLPADFDALGPTLKKVSKACKKFKVAVMTILKIELLLEELFINSIGHGEEDSSKEFIWIDLEQHEDMLVITYADAAPPYNPLNTGRYSPGETADTLEENQFTEVGLILIRNSPFALSYDYQDGRNQITCPVPLEATVS
jgi:serine/threonine-protein kinase RsbW